jgi:hypothetical protein
VNDDLRKKLTAIGKRRAKVEDARAQVMRDLAEVAIAARAAGERAETTGEGAAA